MTGVDLVQFVLLYGSSVLTCAMLALFIVQKVITKPYPAIRRHKEEKYFLDPNTIKTKDFPSIDEDPSIDLSVIIPAYDEEKRLPIMLDECLEYLEQKSKSASFTFEVIVVSDGSRDGTVSLALKYSQRFTAEKVRVLELIENRGKGGAVRMGMLSARGRFLLFADADGATKFADHAKLEKRMELLTTNWSREAIVIGSRAHLEEKAVATRSAFRTFLMHGFHFCVWLFAVRHIRDTQCGFKLLTRSAARRLFRAMHVERWAFDVELLYLAQRLNIPIEEVAVTWKEIDGSKLSPFWSWLQMGNDLFLMWFRYAFSIWKVKSSDDHCT